MLTQESRLRDFPNLARMIYLNTAAEGIIPTQVIDSLTQYAQDKLLGMAGRLRHEAQWHAARQQIALEFGLEPDDIGICSCSSEAFNLAALALRLREGDEVVINDLDFPAGATPWLQACCPATVRLWRAQQGLLRIEDLMPLITPRTRLVSTSLVSFYNGFRINLAEVAGVVRKNSPALLAVDVTQALGRCVLDLSTADLIISSTHKWLLATHGGGLVGVSKKTAAQLTVPAGGWFNLQNPFDVDRFEQAVSKPGAASFCVGMPNYPAVYAVAAAFRYLQQVTVSAIEEHAAQLVRICFEGLRKLPVQLLTPNKPDALSGIIAFRHSKAEQIYQRLQQQNIHVMHHAGRLRVSLHGYNSAMDVERFLAGLQDIVHHP